MPRSGKEITPATNLILFHLSRPYQHHQSVLRATQTVDDMIKEKTLEEIRKTFNIENDLKPTEQKEVRKENA
uniref:SKP1 component dimerisation domain-containing protein n=1 Tax=Solanum lycopersicum TaxID=4081 RepID=A0A3Q7EEF2_SOLLC